MTAITDDQQQWMQNTVEPVGGAEVRITATGAENLYMLLTTARPDWSSTTCWQIVSQLKRDHADHYSYPEMVCAAMWIANNPLITSIEGIIEEGDHWDNTRSYLAGNVAGRRYADQHSAAILMQAADDHRRRDPESSARGHAAASAALAKIIAARRQA